MKNFIKTLPLKAMGMGLLVLTAFLVNISDGDVTFAFITVPMALAMVLSKGVRKEDLKEENE